MQLEAGISAVAPGDGTVADKLHAITPAHATFSHDGSAVFATQLVPGLAEAGIHLSNWHDLDEEDCDYLEAMFNEQIFPILTPLAVDPSHPFPYISNLSLNLAVVLRAPGELTRRIARVKVPQLLPRFIVLPDGERFVPVEQLIARRLPALFPGMEIVEQFPFHVTRNTDYDIDLDGADDMVAAVESVLLRRRRSPLVVRLEVDSSMSEEALNLLERELRLDDGDVYRIDGLLALRGLWAIYALDRPELKFEPWTPVTQTRLDPKDDAAPDLFATIRRATSSSITPTTPSRRPSRRSSRRPPTTRRCWRSSRRSIARRRREPDHGSAAAGLRRGKQVVCIVELKARFDEESNIGWAQRLEDAGVHVVYGIVGLKTHAKLCLVVRNEAGRDPSLCAHRHRQLQPGDGPDVRGHRALHRRPGGDGDVSDAFNLLTGYSRQQEFRTLLVAPTGMRAGAARADPRAGFPPAAGSR